MTRLARLAEQEQRLTRQLDTVRAQMRQEARRYSDANGFRVMLTPRQALAEMERVAWPATSMP